MDVECAGYQLSVTLQSMAQSDKAAAEAGASSEERNLEGYVAEPSLKYEVLAGDLVRTVVGGTGAAPPTDSITCLHASARFIAVGTKTGKVHILDYAANLVRTGRDVQGAVMPARVVCITNFVRRLSKQYSAA